VTSSRVFLLLVALSVGACDDGGGSASGPADAGRLRDAVVRDPDAAPPTADAAGPDAAGADAAPDAGPPDAGPDDGATADATPPDAALQDAALPDDAALADAAPPDGAPVDPARCAPWAALEGEALIAALHEQLSTSYRPIRVEADLGGTPNRYTTARKRIFLDLEWSDDGVQAGYTCLYTGERVASDRVEPASRVMNTEHVRPRSALDRDRESALYSHQESDLHHLFPTLPGVNSLRGSFPFGEPTSHLILDWTPAVQGTDDAGRQVFAPRAETRGDVARAMFYMTARWGLDLADAEEAVLRRWHAADPPDAREVERNGRAEAIQGTRNPFVDCPALAGAVDDFAAFAPRDTNATLPDP
jgi:hypothetical protein